MNLRLAGVGLALAIAAMMQLSCGDRSGRESSTAAPPAAETSAPPAAAPAQPATAPARPSAAPARPSSPSSSTAPTSPPPQASAPAAPAPAPPPPPPPRTVTLPAGTQIAVYTTSTISTQANQSGETFSATLAKAISSEGWVAAKSGSRIEGFIVNSDPGGKVKGVASIAVSIRRLTMADGRAVNVSTDAVTQEAKQTKGKDAKRIGVGAGVGAAVGAIAGGGSGAAIGAAVGGGAGTAASLATRGDPATIPAETLLTFTLNEPLTMTELR